MILNLNCTYHDLLEEIGILRQCLGEISEYVDSLSDPMLVSVSQLLDQKLNKFSTLTK